MVVIWMSHPRHSKSSLPYRRKIVAQMLFLKVEFWGFSLLCDKIRLSWVLTVKTTVIFLKKISLNSCLIGLDQLYTGRAGESSRTWPSRTLWPGVLKVLSLITGSTCFSFSLLLFFLFSFFFLVFAVLVFSLYTATFLQIYKFSSLLPYFPFNSTSCHSPEVVREVLRFTYF